uniref:Uncharacterized protein n=1 Tax=Romanomermis culicivorax TaxID=13658 RepID=A0A915J4B9_ROMCU
MDVETYCSFLLGWIMARFGTMIFANHCIARLIPTITVEKIAALLSAHLKGLLVSHELAKLSLLNELYYDTKEGRGN